VNPFFIAALQLDPDYATLLEPHEFECFASLTDPACVRCCLMARYSHLIRAAEFGNCRTGESSFAKPLTHSVTLPQRQEPIFRQGVNDHAGGFILILLIVGKCLRNDKAGSRIQFFEKAAGAGNQDI
jgi:hypothetical protein